MNRFGLLVAGIIISVGFHSVTATSLEHNSVYRIVNANYTNRSMAASGAVQGAVTLETDENDLKQQWLVTTPDDGQSYYFRNVATGAYLTSPKKIYVQWPLTFTNDPDPSTMAMTLTDYDGNVTIRTRTQTDSYSYAHNDASNTVVSWLMTSLPTQWNFVKIEKTADELAEITRRFQNTADEIARCAEYQTHLDALFNDKACTELKEGLNLSSNPDFNALPAGLRQMARKIESGDWSEQSGDWNSKYARKYRVQLYEPYSEGSAAAGMAGIQAYTNMNNPTGIVGDANDLIYVMVNDDIPEGSTLYIGAVPDCNMYNSITAGTQLHKGLNMVMCNTDNSHFFIYYTVNTVKDEAPSQYKVTEFPSIKIHIEGGRLNGFFNYIGDNLYTPDKREDYEYTSQRATHPMYDLLGKYVILHFFLEDTPDLPGDATLQKGVKTSLDPEKNPGANKRYDPVAIMKAWDDMCFSERIMMGIQSDEDILNSYNQGMYSSIVGDTYTKGSYSVDPGFHYSDYFNNRMMGITMQAKGLYMNATSWRTAYAPSTIDAILTHFGHDGIWGPAHEYGHMNQSPICFAGTTEESNNVFSNVALYFCEGSTTSRCDFLTDQLNIFNQGKTFLENGTWGTTRMFWQLWCYYHATKHNTKFYPRLYQLLRKNPLRRDMTSITGKLNPRYDMLHFAKMCCVAAEEDLTDFFTAWGFFVPQDNYHIDDYSIYDCVLTQEDIDAVKQEIADFGFKENKAIILIDDRPGSTKPSEAEHPKEKAGELGGLKDFEANSSPTGDFSFTVDGTTVNVTTDGDGAVGFLIYDNDGNLLGFSNSYSFDLPDEIIGKLLNGEARVDAVGADNTVVGTTNTTLDGTPEQKRQLLCDLIALCEELLSTVDETELHVGSLIPSHCEILEAELEEAKSILENATDEMGAELTETYKSLSEKYFSLLNDEDSRVKIVSGASYQLTNKLYPAKVLGATTAKATGVAKESDEGKETFTSQWILESANDGSNSYYIKNLETGLYLNAPKAYYTELTLTSTPARYTLVTIEPGLYSFAADGSSSWGVHMDSGSKIVHWGTTADASQWRLKLESTPEYISTRAALIEKAAQSKQLIDQAGTYSGLDSHRMQFTDDLVTTNAEYKGPNTADRMTTWQVLFDDDTNTYFHSNYNGENSTDGLDHYIQLTAPAGDDFRYFEVSYTTRNSSSNGTNPRAYSILTSNDGAEWQELLSVNEGLLLGAAVTNSTGELTADPAARMLRFMVTQATELRGGHPYFALSELSITNRGDLSATPFDKYPKVKESHITDVCKALLLINQCVGNPDASLDDLQALLARLNESHNSLLNAMEGITPVEKIVPDPNEITVRMNEEASVGLNIYPEDATDTSVEVTVEPEGVASVKLSESDSPGLSYTVTPIAPGSATIMFRSLDGSAVTAQAKVNVLPVEPESIELSEESVIIKVGDAPLTLSAIIKPDDTTCLETEWSIADETLVHVIPVDNNTALLYAVAMGKTQLTVNAKGHPDVAKSIPLKILPEIPVSSILLYPTQLNVPLNAASISLSVEVAPADAFDTALKWESSNHDVAVVNENTGEIRLTGEGTAVITVSATDGSDVTASAVLNVTEPVATGIYIYPADPVIEEGGICTLSAGFVLEDVERPEVEWLTDDTDIIHIDSDGNVGAVKAGKATVTARAVVNGEELTATTTVTVTPALIKSLWLSASAINIENGSSTLITAYSSPASVDAQYIWSVDDETILDYADTDTPATIELKALADGTTAVNVQSGNNPDLIASCIVTVSEGKIKSLKILVDFNVIELSEGVKSVYVTYEPSNLALPGLEWSSSDESVARVTSFGALGAYIEPLSVGTATIKVNHADNKDINDSADIEVIDTVTAIARLLGDDSGQPVDVYTLSGIPVRLNVTVDGLTDLRAGFYIVRQGSKTIKILLK